MYKIEDLIDLGFQCGICGHFEPCYDELKKHVRRKHQNYVERHIDKIVTVGFECRECKYFKHSYPEITEHIRTMHNALVTKSNRHKVAKEVRRP